MPYYAKYASLEPVFLRFVEKIVKDRDGRWPKELSEADIQDYSNSGDVEIEGLLSRDMYRYTLKRVNEVLFEEKLHQRLYELGDGCLQEIWLSVKTLILTIGIPERFSDEQIIQAIAENGIPIRDFDAESHRKFLGDVNAIYERYKDRYVKPLTVPLQIAPYLD